ncbi:MAG: glycosyltransferase [Minisyncoccia bacterium]|jgi:glycosyltransferase involved in cell wall biosynthesis
MIIELFGLPASGKTTLAELIQEKTGFKIIKISNKTELFFYNIIYFIEHPVNFIASFVYTVINSNDLKIFRYKLINAVLYQNAKYQKALSTENAILDQGFCQNFLSIFETVLDPASFLRFSKFIELPDKLIIIDLDLDETQDRSTQRGYWARGRFGENYLKKWKYFLKLNFELFKTKSRSFGIPVKILNGNDGVDENYLKIEDFLKQNNGLTYIANVKLPTEKARGLQIIKACESFAETGAPLKLLVPSGRPPITADPFEYYRAKKIFRLIKLPNINISAIFPFAKRFDFYTQSLTFGFFVVIYLFFKRDNNSIVYSRDYSVLLFLAIFGFNPIAEIHDYRTKKPKIMLSHILKKSRKIIVNSTGTLKLLEQHYPKIEHSKVLVVPNGVDVSFFNIGMTKDEARDKLKMPRDAFIFGYVGRLETAGKEKGISDLITAFSLIIEKNKIAVLFIVGGPNDLKEQYKRGLSDDDSREKIVFTGQVDYQLIPIYLKAIDCAIIPLPNNQHAKTTSPIKLFEYMAAGKPIIISKLASLNEIVGCSDVLQFEPGNPQDLAKKMDFIINNPQIISQLSEHSKENAEKYSWSNRARKISKFISTDGN